MGHPHYHLNERGEFIITDYNAARPFSSFLPGIAGENGIPLWVFYVNRGQCICSLGVQDKEHPIMEFQPANRAYELVGRDGFRTFLKFQGDGPVEYYEPFQSHYRDQHLDRTQKMSISPSHLTLEELNRSLNLGLTVEYFPVPQDMYAGLVRVLRIENLGSSDIDLSGLDGLPVIVPYGVNNFALKNMRRTIEAFVEVCNVNQKAPFFKAKVEPADRPDVARITRGNFYLGFQVNASGTELLAPIVDPGNIFGSQTDYSFPERFLSEPAQGIVDAQILESQMPCAMGMFHASIPSGESYTYVSIIGHAPSVESLNRMIPRVATSEYVETCARENREVIDRLTQNNLVVSSEPTLDYYTRQNFLDNVMRGGFPVTFTGSGSPTTFHLYSRKHGDLERDYNDFCLTPTRYSQGNGNFRDMNQNRRSDLLFNPDVGTENVEYFYNLIQLDGFNPLVLKEIRFEPESESRIHETLKQHISSEDVSRVTAYLKEPFTPGALLAFLDDQKIEIVDNPSTLLREVLSQCRKISVADHGEGFWIDHWTYNLDLLENFLSVYPDRIQDLLFNKKIFTYYQNAHRVQARAEKYVIREGKPRQLGAVIHDEEVEAMIAQRSRDQHKIRVAYGAGEVYFTSLFGKILCLIANKLASLDPEGVGIEMEAGKPGWYDALNGLPGLFGSSICETLETKRHILFLMTRLSEYERNHDETLLFAELKEFMEALHDLLISDRSPIEFWDAASDAGELFRSKTRLGISGEESTVKLAGIRDFFTAALEKLNAGIKKAEDQESNTIFTYFRHEVIDYEELDRGNPGDRHNTSAADDDLVHIKPLKFRSIPLPLFLEGPVHYLRCEASNTDATTFAMHVKKSDLYDKSLKMYKVNASLADQPMEIGRARVFSPGWLENGSIWLHMEYKYMLELLRNGLFAEFYSDFRNVFIPFLSPDTYGRSILENSSFLASSAHPDSSIHGNGYVARLSGATAEFIQILGLMVLGPRPFDLGANGELMLCLKPALPAWLFTREPGTIRVLDENEWRELQLAANTFSFMFLGKILVTYHNPELKDTFGTTGVAPVHWEIRDRHGKVTAVKGRTLGGDIAADVRERKVNRIDIHLR